MSLRTIPLWGRMASCGRLAIGLLVACATLEKRPRSLRLTAFWGRMASCGRLAIGLSLAPRYSVSAESAYE